MHGIEFGRTNEHERFTVVVFFLNQKNKMREDRDFCKDITIENWIRGDIISFKLIDIMATSKI